uniref:Uncharacterized protein n=1 Tax=Arundo donax TaxID=35708 RepID=A0A0A9BCC9_ARUDO
MSHDPSPVCRIESLGGLAFLHFSCVGNWAC